jgi:branched-chain amino acid transport system substrate-binding protein
MNKKIIGLIVILVIIVGGIIIHQVYGSNEVTENEIIKIGVIAPLSGKAATYGINSREGLALALQKIEQDKLLPNYKIELVYEDDGFEVKNSVNAFQKLISVDGVNKIIGPVGSSNTRAIAPLTDGTDIIVITHVAGADDITIGHENVFRLWQKKSKQLDPMFNKIAKDGYKKIAIVTAQTDSTLSARKVFVNHYEDIGEVQIVLDEKIDESETDFGTILLKAKESGADSLFFNIYVGQFGNALWERVNMGFDLPTFTTNTVHNEQDLSAAGSAMEGIWFSSNNLSEGWFVDVFNETYSREPEQEAATAYDALMIYARAINEVGNDNQKIMKYLNDFENYSGAVGSWYFDEDRNVPLPGVIKIMKNGEFKVIE